jgi:hypothetical protein
MTPEERQVITGIFERLKAAENHPRDPEAERLIADLVASQPYAPYAMAQSIYVSEQALANLGRRVEELEHQLQEARSHAQPQSGGFLSSLFGGSPRPDAQPSPARGAPSPWGTPQQGYGQGPQGYAPAPQGYAPGLAPQAGPWGGQPQGGGFLQSAMTTAAGVAGGMVLANVLTGSFSHHGAAGLGSLGGASGASTQGLGGVETADHGATVPDSSGNSGTFVDHDHAVGAAYDRSRDDGAHSDSSNDHGTSDDAGTFDDPGFSGDDSGFSGDV